jgi:threonine aldolase
VINLRSDTATKPTPGMREAIAAADVGDEQLREDPTVNALEGRMADLLGHEEAVFVPTATMANEVALRVLSQPGDELIAEEQSHILLSELGGAAVFAGLMARPIASPTGRFTPDEVRAKARDGDLGHTPTTRVVAIENTHNSSGGRVWPLAEVEAIAETCRELGLALHLDGARLFNASVASGEQPASFARLADTVTICFSKGLGCPFGAIVAGSADRMLRARRFKHQFGGAMRQAGIAAAACVHALDHHVERLAEDHARAHRLAEALYEAGAPVDLEQVETNFVQIDVGQLGLSQVDALERLASKGVRLSATSGTKLRAVTHLDVTDDDIERAAELIPRALGVPARVG